MSVAQGVTTTNRLRSVYTSNLPALLAALKASAMLSNCPVGKVAVLRLGGDTITTRFCRFPASVRLTVGTSGAVWHIPTRDTAAQRLDAPGHHDACYLPRGVDVTGKRDIHEIAGRATGDRRLLPRVYPSAASALRKSWFERMSVAPGTGHGE